jgi:hypothetical protein
MSKTISLFEDCTYEIIEEKGTMPTGEILYFPLLLFKYKGDTIFQVLITSKLVEGKSENYTALDMSMTTKIGNIIKHDIAYRKTPFIFIKDSQCRKGRNRTISLYSFQIKSLTFKRTFKMILNILYNYYLSCDQMPKYFCYQRVTGNSVNKNLSEDTKPEHIVFDIAEVIERYDFKSFDVPVMLSRDVKVGYE